MTSSTSHPSTPVDDNRSSVQHTPIPHQNVSSSSTPAGGFGLPAPVQGTGTYENNEIAKQRREKQQQQMMNSTSTAARSGSNTSGPQPHPVPNLHGPASPIQVPNKSPAPTRGCSPSRFKMRMNSNADRSATEMSLNNSVIPNHEQNNNQQQQQYYSVSTSGVSNPGAVLTNNNVNDKSPSVRMRGPLNTGGHDFVVDHHQNERQHSPSGASCPVCGALRLPNIDLRNDAALAVLDKRKAELQRELFKIDQMMMNRKRTQPNVDHNYSNPDSTPNQPALNRTYGINSTTYQRPVFSDQNSTITSVLNSQPRSHNNSPSRRQMMSSTTSAHSNTSAVSRDHASLINDLRQTADSLMNGKGSGPGGSISGGGGSSSRHENNSQTHHSLSSTTNMTSSSYSPSGRPRTPRGTHDSSANLMRNGKPVMMKNHHGSHAAVKFLSSTSEDQNISTTNPLSSTETAIAHIMRGNVNPNLDSYKTFSVADSTPAERPAAPKNYEEQLNAAEEEVRQMIRSGARAGRPNPPASSSATFPSLEQSPMRDDMYSEDHRDTLKELAMLRVEREMRDK